MYSERSEARITFVRLKRISTSESSGGPGAPTTTLSRTWPIERESAGLPSPTPTVRWVDPGWTGLQEPNASGGPCVRFGEVHGFAAGTSGTRKGDAPLGRGCGLRVSTGRGCQSGAKPPVVYRDWKSVPSGLRVKRAPIADAIRVPSGDQDGLSKAPSPVS